MNIAEAIDLLKSYHGPLGLTHFPGATEELIKEVQKVYGVALPEDFKALYRFCNGFETTEDLFRFLPIEEIIANKEPDNQHIIIAEYMVYIDTWELIIDTGNPDNYSIIMPFHKGERMEIKNSLPEFIDRFLRGGVFDKFGLYFWNDELKAKINGPTNPEQIVDKLSLFSLGLKCGLVLPQEVIEFAEWIVLTECDRHQLFMSLATAQVSDEMICLLHNYTLEDSDPIYARVLFGRLYQSLKSKKVSAQQATQILDKLSDNIALSDYERDRVEFLGNILDWPQYDAYANLINFLSLYKNLYFHIPWDRDIENAEIEKNLIDLENGQVYGTIEQRNINIETKTTTPPKTLKILLVIVIFFIVSAAIIFLTIKYGNKDTPSSAFVTPVVIFGMAAYRVISQITED